MEFQSISSPSHEGAWERLVRSVKTALCVVLKGHSPKEEVLLTVLSEIEHCVNSRPLTHVSIDFSDQEALTPNHFLIGSSSGVVKFNKYHSQAKCTRKQWLTAQNFSDAVWKRWLREYLPTLISRNKWQKPEAPLKIGDIVLISDINSPRNQWKKGVITKVYPAADGQVRIADVKTMNGILKRPARRLIKFAEAQQSDLCLGGENVTNC